MVKRIQLIAIPALLGLAVLSAVAIGGVQVGPSAPNAQVGQYIDPTEIGGGNPAPPGPTADTGAGGELAFTGFVALPLVMVAALLILGSVALRRFRDDASDSPVTA